MKFSKQSKEERCLFILMLMCVCLYQTKKHSHKMRTACFCGSWEGAVTRGMVPGEYGPGGMVP